MIVYSTGCPLCKILLKRLDESNIPYELCKDEKIMEQKGIMSVPILETDEGKLLTFNAANQYLKEKSL